MSPLLPYIFYNLNIFPNIDIFQINVPIFLSARQKMRQGQSNHTNLSLISICGNLFTHTHTQSHPPQFSSWSTILNPAITLSQFCRYECALRCHVMSDHWRGGGEEGRGSVEKGLKCRQWTLPTPTPARTIRFWKIFSYF